MKIIDCIQGSEDWLRYRSGLPTASELNELISPTGVIRKGDMPESYLALKLAEKWMGGPVLSFSGGAMEQGTLKESEAVPYFELTQNIDIRRVGLVLNDEGTFGASPDGLCDGFGVELKCPQPNTHAAWLIDNVVPTKHLWQCYGGMYATGLPVWRFGSYCRGFPHLWVEVERDENAMETIASVMQTFTARLAKEYARLIERNGGPPQHPTPSTSEQLNDHPFI